MEGLLAKAVTIDVARSGTAATARKRTFGQGRNVADTDSASVARQALESCINKISLSIMEGESETKRNGQRAKTWKKDWKWQRGITPHHLNENSSDGGNQNSTKVEVCQLQTFVTM